MTKSNSTPKPTPVILKRDEHPISRKDIDKGVLNILYTLKKHNYRGCLVGGCIRDLLLGIKPKDFDVATDATPEQIKRIFPRCYIIGRRFRLAHVYVSHHEFIEVATFRGPVPDAKTLEDLSNEIEKANEADEAENPTRGRRNRRNQKAHPDFVANNIFGTLEEDSFRRDFSINGLFYDINQFKIYDYVGGLADIETRTIRMIGDPDERLREDPVRIIRAAKFAGKLNCKIEAALAEKCTELAPLIDESHPSRRIEEIFKILQSGSARLIFEQLQSFNASQYLIPGLNRSKETLDGVHDRLGIIDDVIGEGYELTRGVLMAVLFYGQIMRGIENERETSGRYVDVYKYIKHNFKDLAIELRLTKTEREIVRRSIVMQDRLVNHKHRRFSKRQFIRMPHFKSAFEVFEINALATGENQDAVDYWKELIENPPESKSKHKSR